MELLATLLCDMACNPDGDRCLCLEGTTDNFGNQYAVKKFMTTKFPLCGVLMQLASRLASGRRNL
eukprot:13207213-Alexandrium_andersonii.AAC.1